MALFKLFTETERIHGNALLNWKKNSATEIIAYAASYRNAARNLVSVKEWQNIGSIDHAALPTLFLYRHAFELYLKALAFMAAVLSINEIELVQALPRLWKEHSLVRLLEMSAPVLHASSSRRLTQSGEL